MPQFAKEIIGTNAGQCSLSVYFNTIHTRMIGDPTLGTDVVGGPMYPLLARLLATANPPVPFDTLVSPYIRFALLQRNSVELIRQAYTALGQAQNLPQVLPALEANLRDENIEFLK